MSINIYLEKGTYYIQINGYRREDYDKVTGEYTCRTSFTSSGVTNREDDNSFADANNITIGDKIVGQISVNDDFDTYKFTLSQVGCVKLEMTSYMKYYGIKLFNSDGEQVWYSNQNEWNETVGYRSDTYDLYLEKDILSSRLMDIGFMTGIKLLADMYAILPLQHQAYRLMEMIMISELQSRYHGIRHM